MAKDKPSADGAAQKAPVTEAVTEEVTTVAPVAPVAPPPVQRMIERQGGASEPRTHKYPEIRGGVCEHHGTMDPLVPAEYQYKLCDHFRGMGDVRCSYCPEGSDPSDIVGHHTLHVWDHPTDRNAVVAVCTSYECNRKHQARFKLAG